MQTLYEDIMEKVQELLRKPEVPVIGLLISVICIIGALFSLKYALPQQQEVQPPLKVEAPTQAITVVDIEGAVQKPGVYELKAEVRLIQALTSAGGLTKGADRYYVARNMNLSKHIIDEEKIYIPFLTERTDNIETTLSSVRINSATSSQLELLPGIGPVTANNIIKNRPYESIDELISKKALGQKTLESIKDLIEL